MADAKVKFSVLDGTFELEGSETFVSKQLDAFSDVIRKAMTQPRKPSKLKADDNDNSKNDNGDANGDYSSVFAVQGEEVKVLADIPGERTKEKTINAGLITAFASETHGKESTSFEAIREVCKHHSCLDAPNFARYLKSDKKSFLVSGTRRKQVLKLTAPGKKTALALVESLATE